MDLLEAPKRPLHVGMAGATTARQQARSTTDPSNPLALYLRDISKVPLLSAEDEVRLACDIEVGVLAAERLASDQRLSADDRSDLAALADQGERSKRVLIESNLRLVVALAKRYQGCGTAMLDLIQEGNIGLMRAVEKFDHRRGFKFSTYASWWIRQAIARGYGDQGRTIRVPVHVVEAIHRVRAQQRTLTQELGRTPTVAELARASDLTTAKTIELLRLVEEPISLDIRVGDGDEGQLADLICDDESETPIDEISQRSMRREIEQLLSTVTPREQDVLRRRFGLSGVRTHTLEEVGKELGVTRERVRQIEARALARIRETHSFEGFREYLHA
jgi:RNA polymerase primary sigma factor